jgi:hypothetical protein
MNAQPIPSSSPAWFVLDTATMPFEEVPGNPGARRHTLLEVPEAPGFVRIVYGPPGFSSNVQSLLQHGPHRHYHRSVTERHYILAGDYPIWHWVDAAEGHMTRLRRHHYLENPPRTVHGIMPGSVPQTGYGIVQWTDGFGTELFEPGADAETLTVPPEARLDPGELRRPILVHAEDLPWSAHASVGDWTIRELGAATPTCPPARLVNIPAHGAKPLRLAPMTSSRWLWLLIISGDLRVRARDATDGGAGDALSLREGAFLAWRSGASVVVERERASGGGCVALCIGHDLATTA